MPYQFSNTTMWILQLIDKVFSKGLLRVWTWLWLWKWNHMQINTNKYLTICWKNYSKLRKQKVRLVTGPCGVVTVLRDVFRTLLTIYDGAPCKRVSDWKPLTVFANSTILHIWQGFDYVSTISSPRESDSSCLNIEVRLLMTMYKTHNR